MLELCSGPSSMSTLKPNSSNSSQTASVSLPGDASQWAKKWKCFKKPIISLNYNLFSIFGFLALPDDDTMTSFPSNSDDFKP